MTLRPKLSGRLLSTPVCDALSTAENRLIVCSPSKSLPKRFRRRPRETVSWKRMLANRTPSSRPERKSARTHHIEVDHQRTLVQHSRSMNTSAIYSEVRPHPMGNIALVLTEDKPSCSREYQSYTIYSGMLLELRVTVRTQQGNLQTLS